MESNLLSHQIATLIQDLAAPEYEGAGGLTRILSLLNTGLTELGSDITRASLSDFRKLYHQGWTGVARTVCPTHHRELVTDRLKKLIF